MIIGIAGNINSGKDTVASMLNYMFAVGKNKASFGDWMTKRLGYDNAYQHKIIHFAEVIKLNLSNIFDLSLDVFNNRKFKDELWYVPSTGKFIEENKTSKYNKIILENALELDCSNPNQIVKIRTLIQIYAEHCKVMFGHSIWIKSTLIQSQYIEQVYKICIIPDVRFNDESKAIMNKNGIIIKLERPNNEIQSNHKSENNYIECNYLVKNDTTLSNLFYKILAIYDTIKC